MFYSQNRRMLKKISLSPLHIHEKVSLTGLRVPIHKYPIENAYGTLKSENKSYAKLVYGAELFEGGHGILQLAKRHDMSGGTLDAIVKKPKEAEILGSEAILQWIARNALEPYRLQEGIPQVYDIFRKGSLIRFSMEFIKGDFPYVYLAKVKNPDIFFFQLLSQVCILLYFLEKEIFLDHRDLKANNLYIRETPVNYTVDISGVSFTVKAPFQVIILDFGFACIGDSKGVTKINIANDVFPNSDPCPKEGRDLFHLLTSFWSIPSVRERMSAETQAEVDSWLVKDTKDFSKLTRKLRQTDWVYVVTGDPKFNFPMLSPLSIFHRVNLLLDSIVASV